MSILMALRGTGRADLHMIGFAISIVFFLLAMALGRTDFAALHLALGAVHASHLPGLIPVAGSAARMT